MRKAKVKTDFSHVADSEIDTDGGEIVTGLTGNASFTLTDVGFQVTDLNTAVGIFTTAKRLAASGNHSLVADKNTKKRTLVSILGHIGRQVNEQGDGDVTKLESTNYPMADGGSPVHPPKPTGQKLERGANAGDVKCMVDAFKKAHGYAWFFTLTSDTETDPNHWDHQFSTSHSTTIHGLTSGQRYKICCSYQGATGEAYVFSDAQEIVAP